MKTQKRVRFTYELGAINAQLECKGAGCEKRHFLRYQLYLKTMILPRQARDKHRESTHLEDRFVQVRLCSDHIRDVCVSRPGADAVSLGLVWVSIDSTQVNSPVRFKLGGRPILSAHLNVETARSQPTQPEI